MAAANAMLSGPIRVKVATATAGACTVTITAPKVGQTIFLNGVIISASAAPAAAVEATITGPEVVMPIEIPAATFGPIGFGFGTHYVPCLQSANLVVTVPSLGSGVTCSLIVTYAFGDL